jgi:hypothetical protein
MWHNDEMSAHDLVIRNASLVDGTGAPARMADVAVSDGVITEVGPRLAGAGSREIDADGLTRRNSLSLSLCYCIHRFHRLFIPFFSSSC